VLFKINISLAKLLYGVLHGITATDIFSEFFHKCSAVQSNDLQLHNKIHGINPGKKRG
jgi:hypothetical protein